MTKFPDAKQALPGGASVETWLLAQPSEEPEIWRDGVRECLRRIQRVAGTPQERVNSRHSFGHAASRGERDGPRSRHKAKEPVMGLGKKTKAKAQIIKGKTKKQAGKVTGNNRLKAKGKAGEVTGKLKLKREKIKDSLKH